MDVYKKYPSKLKGQHNPGVYVCPYCDNNMFTNLLPNIVGFSNSLSGRFVVVCCNECNEYFYFHAMSWLIGEFINTVMSGESNYYHPNKQLKESNG
jgi:hypothetical protein